MDLIFYHYETSLYIFSFLFISNKKFIITLDSINFFTNFEKFSVIIYSVIVSAPLSLSSPSGISNYMHFDIYFMSYIYFMLFSCLYFMFFYSFPSLSINLVTFYNSISYNSSSKLVFSKEINSNPICNFKFSINYLLKSKKETVEINLGNILKLKQFHFNI